MDTPNELPPFDPVAICALEAKLRTCRFVGSWGTPSPLPYEAADTIRLLMVEVGSLRDELQALKRLQPGA